MPSTPETTDENDHSGESLADAVARLSLSDDPDDAKKLFQILKMKRREIGEIQILRIMEHASFCKQAKANEKKLKK